MPGPPGPMGFPPGPGLPPGPMMGGPSRGMMKPRGRGTRARGGRGRGAKISIKNKDKDKQMEMNKPWVTDAMKNEIMKKHKLHQKAKKSKLREDLDIFKEQRNKVTTMLREAKLEYIGAHPEEDVAKILAEAAIQGNKNEDSNGDASAEANEDSADASPHVRENNEGEAVPLTMEQDDETQGNNEEITSEAIKAIILD